ncbi:seryl-tRNA synthetase family protein [Cryptosporidium muris RN66]|uniref:serine--tRNA ligase n=1 Tax=Cryptosporidium muris (strain RN66) TaxID=441375 RepID=B6AA95_CRYMR|nr:seryl-tRNA synthetase family protein [Cryptosporidium muris RN66]EEA05136.1 seryl-tRNA synthetase family protein [Cryptosporidium muris RN66]|eukprot:XP_002139485.1 seryl-tRNA synthetase family protein [Cryptosporidium muris RN66]
MPIDINRIRVEKGGDYDKIAESEMARYRGIGGLEELVKIDQQWRKDIFKLEQVKKEVNVISKEIAQIKKKDAKANCEELQKKSMELKHEILLTEKRVLEVENRREELWNRIGNIVQPDVPISNTEDDNKVLRRWGDIPNIIVDGTPGKMHHHEVMSRLGFYDSAKGAEIAGHRGYFLKQSGVLLSMALVHYGMNFLVKRGYIAIQPPLFMKRDLMAKAAELKDFEETLYHIPADMNNTKDADSNSLFLIATSEQPLAALHINTSIEQKDLPIKYAGISTCFRKEAGAHGKDTWGLFRVHQFEKVEQFCVTTPEESNEMHEEMINISEEFYQSLGLPYRVVSIVSGALNDAAAKKYDLEAWFPGYNNYRELVSCSNCTDYQSRALECRMGFKKGDREKLYCHFLNGTLCAVQRTLCCIAENYQTTTGLKIPAVLQPYLGMDFIPYPDICQSNIEDLKGNLTSE